MKLIIMRHGQAELEAPSDARRPLTAHGRQQVSSTAKKLQCFSPNRIIASPYLRAQQTGALVAKVMGLTLETDQEIVPEGSPYTVIRNLSESGVVMLVSHMPLVSSLTGLLCDGAAGRGPSFSAGSAVVLEMPLPGIGTATLLQMVRP